VGRIADLRFASADELQVTDILLAAAPSEEER
jgi:valyl-tRNA synthetase